MNAKQMAIAGAPKQEPSLVIRMKWAEVKERFAKQVKKMAGPGQRNHAAQVESGWNHIKGEVLSVQSTLQVVQYAGAAKRRMPPYLIVDGYHRVEFWMSLEDGVIVTDACPFTELNVEIHTVTAKTKEEAIELTDKIARTFNSMECVKRNGDFLSAAVRQAGLDARSTGYRTGRGSGVATFLKRAIGNPQQSTPELTAAALADLPAHRAMDLVLHAVEMLPALRSKRGRMFNPGVMQAMFDRFQRLTESELDIAIDQVVATLQCYGGIGAAALATLDTVEKSLYKTFCELSNEDYAFQVRSFGNREEQYNRLSALLRDRFAKLGSRRRSAAKLSAV